MCFLWGTRWYFYNIWNCICMSRMVLRINSNCLPTQHWPVGLCSGDIMCFLWGTNSTKSTNHDFNTLHGMVYGIRGKMYLGPYVNQDSFCPAEFGEMFPVLNFKQICSNRAHGRTRHHNVSSSGSLCTQRLPTLKFKAKNTIITSLHYKFWKGNIKSVTLHYWLLK
jgi:hypothetical protein